MAAVHQDNGKEQVAHAADPISTQPSTAAASAATAASTEANHQQTKGQSKLHPRAPSAENVSPDESVWFLNKWSFVWMDPLFRLGWKRPIEIGDIWRLGPKQRVEQAADGLEAAWLREVAAHPPPDTARSPSFLSNVCSILAPFLIKYVVSFVARSQAAVANGQEMPPLSEGVAYALAMLVLQILSTLFANSYQFLALNAAMTTRSAFVSLIYRKSLRLSAAARQDFTSGKVTNIVATDTYRVEQFLGWVHFLVTTPL
eukprot:jgi/Hompol1/591/HPOL_005369-RA